MMIKSAVFATVVAGIAAASATSASAAPRHGYGYGYGNHGYQQSYRHNYRSDYRNNYRHNYRRPVVRTETRCIGRHRVALRINSYGQVISRSVVGRCFSPRFWTRMNNR